MTEQRIAHMAADGLSNPEIAQALFVTTKTVESHLSNVYRKLDIQSRTQLAGGAGAGARAVTVRVAAAAQNRSAERWASAGHVAHARCMACYAPLI